MAIPYYSDIMLPFLRYLSDGQQKTSRDSQNALANEFNLTEEEKKKLQPSGQQPIFANRVSWAKTYLQKAGLVESPRRGVYLITQKGKEVLDANPLIIDKDYLNRFPEFKKFIEPNKAKSKSGLPVSKSENVESVKTPEDGIETGYQFVRDALSSEILSNVMDCSPDFFETLVIDLLVNMGYGGSRKEAGEKLGKTGDEGIDGVINEDKLGLDAIYIQAKRWRGTVGRPEIQKFAGALQGQRAKKGIFITTSVFTKEAVDYVSKIDNKIVLLDGEKLATYMIDNNVGVSTVATYQLKKMDTDYFSDD